MTADTRTPRTDAVVVVCDGAPGWRHMVDADFARQLERELSTLNAQLAKAREGMPVEPRFFSVVLSPGRVEMACWKSDYDALRAKLEAVTVDKEGMMELHSLAQEWAMREEQRATQAEAKLAAALDALRDLRREAIVLSRSYLDVFKDKPNDTTIQGWDKAQWLRAADAADQADALLNEHAAIIAEAEKRK